MCLDLLNFTKKGLSRKVLTGYKIFRKIELDNNRNGLFFQYRPHEDSAKVIFSKWLVAVEVQQCMHNNTYYRTGFHIYKRRNDALFFTYNNSLKVVKVKYKGVLAEGIEYSHPVVVAKRMWVPRQRKGRRNKGWLRKSRQII